MSKGTYMLQKLLSNNGKANMSEISSHKRPSEIILRGIKQASFNVYEDFISKRNNAKKIPSKMKQDTSIEENSQCSHRSDAGNSVGSSQTTSRLSQHQRGSKGSVSKVGE
jgi:hypothetical protein